MIPSDIQNQGRKRGQHVLYYFSGPLYPWRVEKADGERGAKRDRQKTYLSCKSRVMGWGAAGLNYMHRYHAVQEACQAFAMTCRLPLTLTPLQHILADLQYYREACRDPENSTS
jgi:hypothetical protein